MKKFIKEIIPYIIIVIVVILFRTFIATPVIVSGNSMYPNLKNKEVLILYKLSDIKRYDIVVLNGLEDDHYIKRVYGLPGEKIKIEDNKIFINNKEVDDNYAYGLTDDLEEITLKGNEYFILGDNREISMDSRMIGPITKDTINGKAIFRIWPLKKFESIK